MNSITHQRYLCNIIWKYFHFWIYRQAEAAFHCPVNAWRPVSMTFAVKPSDRIQMQAKEGGAGGCADWQQRGTCVRDGGLTAYITETDHWNLSAERCWKFGYYHSNAQICSESSESAAFVHMCSVLWLKYEEKLIR